MSEEPGEQLYAFGQTKRRWLLWLYGLPVAGLLQTFGSTVAVLLDVPRGTVIRPMGLTCWIGVAMIATAVAGVVVGILGIITGRRIPAMVCAGVLCITLCQIPWLYAAPFFRWFAAYRGLILAD